MDDKEKVYAIEFISYTNYSKTSVYNEKKHEYLDVPTDSSFLVKESDLDKYRDYGKGYKSVILVGYLQKEGDKDG